MGIVLWLLQFLIIAYLWLILKNARKDISKLQRAKLPKSDILYRISPRLIDNYYEGSLHKYSLVLDLVYKDLKKDILQLYLNISLKLQNAILANNEGN